MVKKTLKTNSKSLVLSEMVKSENNDKAYNDMNVIIEQMLEQMTDSKLKESPIYSYSIPKNLEKSVSVDINELVKQSSGDVKIVNVGHINVIN